ncbi:MAG TPA: heat-inducible transcriptional repressor HrcA [Chthonomonadaceae bacterium]|nr:heat-inducible transcriptional repressor HrcA [Chthonomonadaceae bacterium]
MPMPQLDTRKGRILQAIVDDYITTAEPVGSEWLVTHHNFGCKSATIRNEMAEMAELGYLAQPHTSAGRIPTDRGYRYYVNAWMNPPAALTQEEAARARASYEQAPQDIEEIVVQTCRILANLTSYPSLVTDPATPATRIRRIYLSNASPRHALMVVLLSTGHVEHRLVEMEMAPADSALVMLANYLNARLADRDLEEIGRAAVLPEVPTELAAYAASLAKIFAALKQTAQALSERRIFLEGTNQILRQPEFKDVGRLENLLNALERRSALYQVLSRALFNRNVTVIIGSENEYEPMQECSLVTSSYYIHTRPAGFLAVLGPTRMDYNRAAAAVGLMARNLSQVLTNLSLA